MFENTQSRKDKGNVKEKWINSNAMPLPFALYYSSKHVSVRKILAGFKS